MSLSFVSSAVQTETKDGQIEETPIESKEVQEVNRRNAHKPLFDQLRQNQEDEQTKRDEFQREIMRGTCALDADDVAHLDAVHQQRSERERKIQQQTQDEITQFRALKALRQQAAINESNDLNDVVVDETDNFGVGGGSQHNGLGYVPEGQQSSSKANTSNIAHQQQSVPAIKVKKRKRRTDSSTANSNDNNPKKEKASSTSGGTEKTKSTKTEDSKKKKEEEDVSKPSSGADTQKNDKTETESGLNTLLAGYGSSSDEED